MVRRHDTRPVERQDLQVPSLSEEGGTKLRVRGFIGVSVLGRTQVLASRIRTTGHRALYRLIPKRDFTLSVLACAQAVFDAQPSSRMIAPATVMIHQIG